MLIKEPSPLRILKKVFHTPTKLPYYIQLAITDVCNLDCGMCPRHHIDTKNAHIDFDVFKKIIDRLDSAEEISLVGLGEPFVYPRIFKAIQYCKSKGLLVKITTNGLLLNTEEKLRDLISSGLDTVTFSVEGIDNGETDSKVHRNYQVFEFIENLIMLKKELDSPSPKIVLQAVLIKNRENDVYDIIKWGAEKGVDRINIIRMTKYFETGLERPDVKEEKEIFKEFSRLRKKNNIRIDCMQDQFFDGLKSVMYKHTKNYLRIDSCCTRLMDYPYITQNGDMIPCCVLPDYVFGNILDTDIKDVWQSDRFTDFRKNHSKLETCSKCDNLRIKQYV
jgi:MoaA/NifB/PqqE/SkfB family radical SAM enzyme